jgi:hypothetical protein
MLNLGPVPLALTDNGIGPLPQTTIRPTDCLMKVLNIPTNLSPDQVHTFMPDVTYQFQGQNYIHYPHLMSYLVGAIKELSLMYKKKN